MGFDDRGGHRVASDKEADADSYHLELGYVDDSDYDRFDLGRRYDPSIHLRTLYHKKDIIDEPNSAIDS